MKRFAPIVSLALIVVGGVAYELVHSPAVVVAAAPPPVVPKPPQIAMPAARRSFPSTG